MIYAPSAQLQATLAEMREFVRERLVPLEPEFVSGRFEALGGRLVELRAEVKQRGWWAPQVPRERGGMGLSLVDHGRVSEVLGFSPLGHYTFGCQAPDAGNIEILMAYGTDAQQERWLAPLIAGEIRSCFAMTEPEHAGSDPTAISTRAVLDGDHWYLNGHKWFASAAEGADFAIVMAVTEPNASSPYARASMLIVPAGTPGFARIRNIPVMGDPGTGYASHAELRFTDCRVPRENVLGPRGAGFAIAQDRLGPGRVHHCMRWIGISERALDMLCRRAAQRTVGAGKPLGTRQTVQNWIAESRAEIDAARLLVLDTAARLEAEGAQGARVQISAIKFHVAQVMLQVIDRAIQVHGALGVTDDTILAWYYRHERPSRIYDGPDEVHKVVVARRILRDYGLVTRSGRG